MRHFHHLQPVVAHRLEWRNSLSYSIDQNFTAATWNGAEARSFEVADNFFQRFTEHLTEVDEFARAKPVDIHLRKFLFEMRQQIEIPLLGELRVMSALHQDLRASERYRLLYLAIDFVEG